MSLTAATIASVDSPANQPEAIGRLAEEVPEHQAGGDAERDLGGQQHAAAPRDAGQGAHGDGGAHAHVERRQDRQRALEQRAGEGAEEAGGARREGREHRPDRKRHHHHPAGDAVQRQLDWQLHRVALSGRSRLFPRVSRILQARTAPSFCNAWPQHCVKRAMHGASGRRRIGGPTRDSRARSPQPCAARPHCANGWRPSRVRPRPRGRRGARGVAPRARPSRVS